MRNNLFVYKAVTFVSNRRVPVQGLNQTLVKAIFGIVAAIIHVLLTAQVMHYGIYT